jgi:hypothetical protein
MTFRCICGVGGGGWGGPFFGIGILLDQCQSRVKERIISYLYGSNSVPLYFKHELHPNYSFTSHFTIDSRPILTYGLRPNNVFFFVKIFRLCKIQW